MTENRRSDIDIMKAIGVLMVIIGHCRLPRLITVTVYMVHLPLFFFISGYLDTSENVKQALKKRLKSLIYPYYMLGMVLVLVVGPIVSKPEGIYNLHELKYRIIALLFGTSINNNPYVGSLWFLCSLFVVVILYHIIHLICKNNIRLVVVISFVIGLIWCAYCRWWQVCEFEFRLPYYTDVSIVALNLYSVGVFYRSIENKINIKPYIEAILMFGSVILGLLLGYINVGVCTKLDLYYHNVDMFRLCFGSGVLFYISALLLILPIYKLCRLWCNSNKLSYLKRLLCHVGQVSILIMAISTYVTRILRLVNFTANNWIICVLTMFITVLLSFVVEKIFPFLYTMKKAVK